MAVTFFTSQIATRRLPAHTCSRTATTASTSSAEAMLPTTTIFPQCQAPFPSRVEKIDNHDRSAKHIGHFPDVILVHFQFNFAFSTIEKYGRPFFLHYGHVRVISDILLRLSEATTLEGAQSRALLAYSFEGLDHIGGAGIREMRY